MKRDTNYILLDEGEDVLRAYHDSAETLGDRKRAEREQEFVSSDGVAMLDAVYAFLGRFVSYPSAHARVAHAIWCVHAHLMRLWDSTPRLALLSPEPASGKSRALEVTELLGAEPGNGRQCFARVLVSQGWG